MAVMLDGQWRTLFELDQELQRRGHTYLTTSISARLRELRQKEFGQWSVDRRHREGASDRVQEYRVTAPQKEPQKDLFVGDVYVKRAPLQYSYPD
jgi:hypothetical protein